MQAVNFMRLAEIVLQIELVVYKIHIWRFSMFKKMFLAFVLSGVLAGSSLAFASLTVSTAPCSCCGAACICEVCECDENGCACDIAGDCACDTDCCAS